MSSLRRKNGDETRAALRRSSLHSTGKPMPRRPRQILSAQMYHVCNRGVEKRRLFDGDDDYAVAEQLLLHAKRRHSVKLHAYCFMPNHWHLVVEQTEAGAVSAFVGSFTRAHAWYLRQRRESIGLGYPRLFVTPSLIIGSSVTKYLRWIAEMP
ncbi:MAG: transposase [Deltaproteobacteria bacterium]|nr:transposase [Deltaproteobacteria bacterium]